MRSCTMFLSTMVVLALSPCLLWAQPTPDQLLEAAKAADSGDVTKLRALLAANFDVNAKLPNGASIWVLAAYKGHADAVHVLLASGAAVNTKMPDGWTASTLASENGHIDVVRALIAAKADVNVANNDGKTALFAASRNGHADVVQALLAAKANVNAKAEYSFSGYAVTLGGLDPVAKPTKGWTALMVASQYGHIDVVRALIAAKADVNAQNADGETALRMASNSKSSTSNVYQEIATLLKQAGGQ